MLNVAALMQTHPETVSPGMTLTRLEERFYESGFTGFPVVEEGRLVGVVSRSDIVKSLLTERSRAEQVSDFCSQMGPVSDADITRSLESIATQVGVRLASMTVADVMIENVVTIESDCPAKELATLMIEGSLHRLPVLAQGKLIGLVTSMDLVRAISDGRLQASNDGMPPDHLIAGGAT
jgi:CBS domain-containing protein